LLILKKSFITPFYFPFSVEECSRKKRDIAVHGNADKESEPERTFLVVEIVSVHFSPSLYKTFPLVPDYIKGSKVLFILTPNDNGKKNLVKKKRGQNFETFLKSRD